MNRLKDYFNASGLTVTGIAAFVFVFYLSLSSGSDQPNTIINQGHVQQFQCDDPYTSLTEWTKITLPHWEIGKETPVRCLRMTTTLTRAQLSVENGPAKLMINAMTTLGRVWLNGEKIDEILHSDLRQRVKWFRPYAVAIPAHLVRDTNVMTFDYFNHDPLFQLGELHIGSEPAIENMIRQVLFISKITINGSNILFGTLGAFLISFSMLFKRERLIGLAGMTMFGWAFFFNMLMTVSVPADYYVLWQALIYGFLAWAVFSFADFMKVIAEIKSNPVRTKLRNLFGISASVICLYFGNESAYYLNLYWVPATIIYLISVLLRCVLLENIFLKNEGKMLILQSSLMVALTFHDYLVSSGQMKYAFAMLGDYMPHIWFEEIYLMQFSMTALLMVTGIIVFKRYRTSQNYQMAEATRITKALQHSEERLREVLQKQHAINNIRLIQSERERLLMEIHDGVGSQLISGMLLAKKQDLSQAAVLDMFQVCMDDVRVIIDCISLGKPANAATMIGALLERQRTRLKGLGIELEFIPGKKPNATNQDISDAQCLHASRIVQECIANAIKHAECNKITVHLRQYRDHLMVVIRDNGEGLAPIDRMELGRGLKNMRKRARLLAGQIRFLSRQDGFSVMLRFKNTTTDDWKAAA
jgi:signal transduction histidine kinase